MTKKKLNSDEKIIFCKKCVESNQRYIGSVSFFDMKESRKQRTIFDNGICGACKYFEYKKYRLEIKRRGACLLLINTEKKWRLRCFIQAVEEKTPFIYLMF